MNTMKKAAAGAVLGGALLAAGGLGLAHAAPPAQSVVSDGNVNVTVTAGGQQVGVIQDVSLASAQALAASACPTAGITPEALQALDVNGTQVPGTCASLGSGLTFTFAQNGLAAEAAPAAENAPAEGSVATTPASPSTAAPTTAR
jgi:hypothetical protein